MSTIAENCWLQDIQFVGKWLEGYSDDTHLPIRGFNISLGFQNGADDHMTNVCACTTVCLFVFSFFFLSFFYKEQ